ncbi:MAG: hypothetical protein HYX76_09965, partial [Acidobacteria bacterium]|nr:hypothetical protein [Acidobacteriota bacterium]
RLAHPAEEVACWNLQDARLQTLPLQLRRQGIQLRELWQPVMLIRYRRDRLVEPASRSRVNLDSEIAAAAANPGVVSAAESSPIGSAVLEVKRAGDELPIALHPFLRLGARKESFSKFLAVYAHMTRQIL